MSKNEEQEEGETHLDPLERTCISIFHFITKNGCQECFQVQVEEMIH